MKETVRLIFSWVYCFSYLEQYEMTMKLVQIMLRWLQRKRIRNVTNKQRRIY